LDKRIIVHEVAAFTDLPSAGSPTGVVLDAHDLTSDEMQYIARQVTFSHTAFVMEADGEGADVRIRFFTPLREIANCAHATIAAHYLRANQLPEKRDFTVKQHTQSGVQNVEIRYEGGRLTVHFRQNEIRFSDVERDTLAELLLILNLPEVALHSESPVMLASPGENRFLLPLNDSAVLHNLMPDFAALKALCSRHASIGCFAFALDDLEEATGRMFAPAIGIDEDVINGNSSGCLGAYLLRLDNALPELNLSVHQGHAFDRPGTVLVTARRMGDKIETMIGGTAATASQISVRLP
jgi:PhzF family phenazine biosynthesis protein